MRIHGGHLDLHAGLVVRGDTSVRLTPIELAVLRVLASACPDPVHPTDLLTRAWGARAPSRTVVVTLGRLRGKLEVDPSDPRVLRTVKGRGYALVLAPEPPRATADELARARASSSAPPLAPSHLDELAALCWRWAAARRAAARLAAPTPEDLLDAPDADGSTTRAQILVTWAELTPTAREVLGVLALAAQPLPSQTLATITGHPAPHVLAALEEGRSLLDDDGALAPLVRAAVRPPEPTREALTLWLTRLPQVATALRPVGTALRAALAREDGPRALLLLERVQELITAHGPLDELPRITAEVVRRLDPSTRADALLARLISRIHLDLAPPWEAPMEVLLAQMTDPVRRGAAVLALAFQRSVDLEPVELEGLTATLATLPPFTPQGLDARTWHAAVLADHGHPEACARFEQIEHDAEAVDPVRALDACMRRAALQPDPATLRRLRRRLAPEAIGSDTLHAALAAGWLAVTLLQQGERPEALEWLGHALPRLDLEHPEQAQQIRVKAAIWTLDDPAVARRLLPSADAGHPTGRKLTRWVLAVLDPDPARVEALGDPELVAIGKAWQGRGPLPAPPRDPAHRRLWTAASRRTSRCEG